MDSMIETEQTPETTERPQGVGPDQPLGRVNNWGEYIMTREHLPGLERRLRAAGWRVERNGDELVCEPDWTAIEKNSQPADPRGSKPCYACGSRLYWRSVYGVTICFRCHPPPCDELVGSLTYDGEAKWKIGIF